MPFIFPQKPVKVQSRHAARGHRRVQPAPSGSARVLGLNAVSFEPFDQDNNPPRTGTLPTVRVNTLSGRVGLRLSSGRT